MRSFSDKERTDTSGYFFIPTPNDYTSAQLLNEYLAISGDTLSSFVRTRQWTDSFVKHHHYEYQHYFMGIPVVAGIVREHFNKEGLYLIHGKIGLFDGVDTINMGLIDPPDLAVNIFLRSHFGYPADTTYYFAWQDTAWENQLKRDLEDSTATWFPTAKLVWVTPELGYTPGPYLRNLQLAYEIRVFCLRPFFDSTFYVSAFRPWEVILSLNNMWEYGNSQQTYCPPGYGPADVWYHGVRCIDTKYRGFPYKDYILKANDNGHNFHTKISYRLKSWGLISNVKDKDNDWRGSWENATSTHWFVQQSWNFYNSYFTQTPNKRVRTIVQIMGIANAEAVKRKSAYYIHLYQTQNFFAHRSLDVVAHEFSHIILHSTTPLIYLKESGALNESFCDMMATSIEWWVEGKGFDWLVGEDATTDNSIRRSLANPKQYGKHIVPDSTCYVYIGQPNTYQGEYWYPVDTPYHCNDAWGVHVNSGVSNYWFYLTVNGGQGVNDHGWAYNVSPLPSIEHAFKIVYKATTDYLTPSATFHDFRIATITAEQALYNVCSYEKTIRQAWYAVGLSTDTTLSYDCQATGLTKPEVAAENVNVIIHNNKIIIKASFPIKSISLLTVTGKSIATKNCKGTKCFLPNTFPSGIYILRIEDSSHQLNIAKLIK